MDRNGFLRWELFIFFFFKFKLVPVCRHKTCIYSGFREKKLHHQLCVLGSLVYVDVHQSHSSTLPRELMMWSWSLSDGACWEKSLQKRRGGGILNSTTFVWKVKRKYWFKMCGCKEHDSAAWLIHLSCAILKIAHRTFVRNVEQLPLGDASHLSLSLSCICSDSCRTFSWCRSFPLNTWTDFNSLWLVMLIYYLKWTDTIWC